ncbi:amine oxidase [Deinococcus proteolyticus MRP]|uniref:Amine oxidase n=1 Tax=Deinococcus proteolyticus (strain ATCC 35074 / DSM 20540 / JCM 6276 / NBRC 101906 / NCIMB 13154 / VKM Ac-1939 / CCM 2703 / MRP) TaxID=693977 RepID=F0RJ68_DEIPM|nr:NAD(P)/FAD-dependent oxidoreductase [Deinococcus proteolyticus]ADY26505.1 amine oxidase [Deinococcus proteolyticus MRP]
MTSRTSDIGAGTAHTAEIVVVGAGLAGLCAARTLQRAGRQVRVLEASEHLGGRVWSREVEGYTIDAGFLGMFTDYPAARRQFDYSALDLVVLKPSAVLRQAAGLAEVMGDPRRDPGALPGDLTAGALTAADRLHAARLAAELLAGPAHALLNGPDTSTREFLLERGFSERSLERFFTPFFGGLVIDRELKTSANLFRYYMRLLITGDVAIPRRGMSELPRQLAAELDVQRSVRVQGLSSSGQGVTLHTTAGELQAKQVIVATDPPTAARLLGEQPGDPRPVERGSLSSTYLHFRAPQALEPQPRLQLNARPTGWLNQVLWLDQVFPGRVPGERGLLIASLWGIPEGDDAALADLALAELREWYGDAADTLDLLAVDRIPHVQYPQPAGYAASLPGHSTALPNVFLASEVTSLSGIQGALESGEKAAAAILGDLEVLSRPRGA